MTDTAKSAPAPVCPLCGSSDAKFLRSRRFDGIDFEYRYHCCQSCTARYVDPLPDDTILAAIYHREYYGAGGEAATEPDLNSYDERLARIEALLGRRGRLLDVGAGIGMFLRRARERGWQGMGVELSRFSVETARAAGLEMVEGAFETASFAEASFDVIHAWAVFEHLRDPRALIHRAARLLRPGGLLVVHTVNVGSLNARYFGTDWEYYQDAGHLVFPTARSLRRVFAAEGFEIREYRTGGNPIGINRLAASNNTKGVKSPFLKSTLKKLQSRVLSSGYLRPLAKSILHELRLGDAFTFYAALRRPPASP